MNYTGKSARGTLWKDFLSLVEAESMQEELSRDTLAAPYPDFENDCVRIPGPATVIF